MKLQKPIRDISYLNREPGGALEKERNFLLENGWIFDPETGFWYPPECRSPLEHKQHP